MQHTFEGLGLSAGITSLCVAAPTIGGDKIEVPYTPEVMKIGEHNQIVCSFVELIMFKCVRLHSPRVLTLGGQDSLYDLQDF